ncbi:MAG: carbohydrate ABC transporter permease [Acidimicrobiales bacterium]
MTVGDISVHSAPQPVVHRRSRADHRRRRREERMVSLRLYGLRRGTVTTVTVICILFALFTLVPIVWMLINSTKTQANIFESFGFWFAPPFRFLHNFRMLFENVDGDGTYIRWLGNTALYAALGGFGATALSALGGYGFAHFQFRGSRVTFYIILAALLVPIAAITLPLYFVYAKVGLINSIWGMILPSMVAPVGIILMRIFIQASVPRELIDAARMDGAGEARIFFRLALPLMMAGLTTVLLLSVVGIWNNYFLPLVIFSENNLYPLTQGLGLWASHASTSGDQNIYPLLVIGGLVTMVPSIGLFLVVQRYWRGGALLGSFAG